MSLQTESSTPVSSLRATRESPISVDARRHLAARLKKTVRGEVGFDAGSRALYATDASNYRQVPIAVVCPVDSYDVVATVRAAREVGAPILGRGGGTSLAGQCCNTAVVLDFSRHMNRVLSVFSDSGLARVEPGTILDRLRGRAARYGLTFGPDPATHNHCTLGGMIGNDSCGVRSMLSELYGRGPRTSHHVEELEIVTYDGERMRVGATPEATLARILRRGGRRADIYRRLVDLRDRYEADIRAGFPDLQRRVSGYNLPALLPENGFHVARLLAGSESTCAITLEATLALDPAFACRTLVVLGYPSVFEAAEHIVDIRAARPVGLEGLDDRLIDMNKKKGVHLKEEALLPPGKGWLLVEFGGGTQEEANARAHDLARQLADKRGAPSCAVFENPTDQARVWLVRESGLGATAFVPGEHDTWPGWEDAAVPVERLGGYLRDYRALLDRHGYDCALYGHFGQGCVHCRINFDLRSREGIDRYHAFTAAAADLVASYGGSLSGEHGDGQARADLLPRMFGPRLMEAFGELKAIWDPAGKMNPGKLVNPAPRTTNLRIGTAFPPAPVKTHLSFTGDADFAHASIRCVGIGNCRRLSGGTMCPSYMVTREEKHSTRGRAHLLFEMLKGEVITDGWRSKEVKESLDLCLSCKGCKGDCPVNVDMATYKAEFLAHYYQGRLRPRAAYIFGPIDLWARILSRVPWAANFFTQTPILGWLTRWLGGIATERAIPRFARRPFRRDFARRIPTARGGREVVLWPDTFNNYFYPRVLMDAATVLEDAGFRVTIPRHPLCCGRPLYDYGFLGRARRLWQRNLFALDDVITSGVPIVGVEPSCVAAFRDELLLMLPGNEKAKRLSGSVKMLGEFLVGIDGYRPPPLDRRAIVHGHCHHKAVLDFSADEQLMAEMGLDMTVLDSGCCGMAGAFGLERSKYDVAMAAGERVLLPAVRLAEESSLIIADGFSCREQIIDGAHREAMNLASVLALAVRERRQRTVRQLPSEVPFAAAAAMRLSGHGATRPL
ncbi:MAG TPA: FAD-binding and (Fe-S)-binding domain-containing protein [Kofleriaceae bacterium]|nr:FAD-binding and (Fe-S)-binding domain-containing protein [Kofleriaceae bacterium]